MTVPALREEVGIYRYVTRGASGDSAQRQLNAWRQSAHRTALKGTPVVLLVLGSLPGARPSFSDTALVTESTLSPEWETMSSGDTVTHIEYARTRVRRTVTQPGSRERVVEHTYDVPIFHFNELDLLIRSIPLQSGYNAILPLYSESTDALEMDSVEVRGTDSTGAWIVRFADPAIVSTYSIAPATRAILGLEVVPRKSGRTIRRLAEDLTSSMAGERLIGPGDSALMPDRVRLGTDTLALLVTPSDSAERLSSVLIRSMSRVDGPGGPLFRETQRYESHEPGRAGFSYDTLDVDARTLRVLRSFSSGGGVTHDVRVADLRIDGTITTRDSGRREVHAATRVPAFESMMSESFIAAFPLSQGMPIGLPLINAPDTTVRIQRLDFARQETIRTANGPVPCLVVTSGNGTIQFWVSVADGRLMRLHWTLANGTAVWKLPQRDVGFRQ
ncbi:MAG: hypothetical protein ACREN6_09670 [Gemmatimonadaceae bacterium]